jgi:hypothetical protein
MKDTVQRWISEFNISDEEKEPLNFLLLKDFFSDFNKNKNNHIIDKQNRIIIDDRVIEKTEEIQSELDEKIDYLDELQEEHSELQQKCSNLYSEVDSLKNSRQADIDKSVSDTKESQNELKQELRNQIDSLKINIDVLESERENILSNFLKDNDNKTSFDTGVIGENEMFQILRSGNWDRVIDVHSKDHSGDFIVEDDGKKYIIDVKNYQSPVPGEQVRKLAKDIETNACDGGAIISLHTGIYNPNTNLLTKDNTDQILVSGKSIVLLSHATQLPPDFINSIMKSLCRNSPSNEAQNVIHDKHKKEIINYIMKKETEIESERKSFQRIITRKHRDLVNFKDTWKEIIGDFDDISDDDSSNPTAVTAIDMGSIPKLKLAELKEALDERGLPRKGKKAELVAWLLEAVEGEGVTADQS